MHLFNNLKITIVVGSEIPSNKDSYHKETNQSSCKANQLTGFYKIQVLRKFISEQTLHN